MARNAAARAQVLEPPSHLHASVRDLLGASDAERIAFMGRDRWLGYPTAVKHLAKIQDLYSQNRPVRPLGGLLVGATNNGKTALLRRMLHLHPAHEAPDGERTLVPVLYVQCISQPTEKRLFNALLRAVNWPQREVDNIDMKLRQVLHALAE